jgi:hypothetical protein
LVQFVDYLDEISSGLTLLVSFSFLCKLLI